jgi:hypothetical protein
VAILASMVLGFYTKNVSDLFLAVIRQDHKIVPGGGPVESLIRMATQQNITIDLDRTLPVRLAQFFDQIFMSIMKAVVDVLPDFGAYSNTQFVVGGFDVPIDRVLVQAAEGFGFLLALFLAGHLFLRMRELAK